MNSPAQSVWQRLSESGLVRPGEQPELPVASPWYIKALLGFSGWLAALFGFAFFGLGMAQLLSIPSASLIVGAVLLVVGVALSRLKGNEFVDGISLVVSLVGQGLFAWGIASIGDGENFQVLYPVMTLLYLVLIVVSNNYLHRVLFSIFLVATIALWLNQLRWPISSVNALILPSAILWLNEFRWPRRSATVRPIAYGLTIGIIAVNALLGWLGGGIADLGLQHGLDNIQPSWLRLNLYKFISALALVYVVIQGLRVSQQLSANLVSALSFAGALVLVWAAWPASGIVTGVVILFCGFAGSNRVLIGLGIIALLTFVSSYYYQMDTTLLTKSIGLATVGAGLLIGRALMLVVPRQ